MKLRLTFFVFAMMLCGALTWALLRAREETRRQEAERALVESGDRELDQHLASLKAELAATKEEIAKSRLMVAATVNPAERAREAVGPLVARLKQEHVRNPPPVPPVPPQPAGYGLYFPELLSDPEYNRLYSTIVRDEIDERNRPLLKKLGVPPAVAEQVIDLLTERQMVSTDHRSISEGMPGEIYKNYQAFRAEIETKVHALLGDEAYHGFTEDIVREMGYSNGIGGSRTVRTVTREIPDSRLPEGTVPALGSLELRLSYSSAPLTEIQKNIVRDWLLKTTVRYPVMHNEPFVEKVRSVLTPEQQFALDEVKAEDDARDARQTSPKAETSPSKPKS